MSQFPLAVLRNNGSDVLVIDQLTTKKSGARVTAANPTLGFSDTIEVISAIHEAALAAFASIAASTEAEGASAALASGSAQRGDGVADDDDDGNDSFGGEEEVVGDATPVDEPAGKQRRLV